MLSNLAKRGLTIVTVIHQPRSEIFSLIDDVLLLGRGGKVVYLGPTNEARDKFAQCGFECPVSVNPSDFFIDVIVGMYDDRMKFTIPEGNNVMRLSLLSVIKRD